MTKGEIAELFRAKVTQTLDEDLETAIFVSPMTVTKEDLVQFTGLGMAMTANMVRIIASQWDTTPSMAWEIILQLATEKGLPGTESP